MTEKIYKIVFDNKLLGTTKLEFGNPPMGIVFGQIFFAESTLGFDFFNNITLITQFKPNSNCFPIKNIKSPIKRF